MPHTSASRRSFSCRRQHSKGELLGVAGCGKQIAVGEPLQGGNSVRVPARSKPFAGLGVPNVDDSAREGRTAFSVRRKPQLRPAILPTLSVKMTLSVFRSRSWTTPSLLLQTRQAWSRPAPGRCPARPARPRGGRFVCCCQGPREGGRPCCKESRSQAFRQDANDTSPIDSSPQRLSRCACVFPGRGLPAGRQRLRPRSASRQR